METKTVKQSVMFKTSPHEIYEALMDSGKHSQFTGDEAKISRKTSGKFTAFDGYNEGVSVELVPDKKIVQTWRASDWPEGHYSQVTFLLKEVKMVHFLPSPRQECRRNSTRTYLEDGGTTIGHR